MSLINPSLASAPLLQKDFSAPDQPDQTAGELGLRTGPIKVRCMDKDRSLFAHHLGDLRVSMTERADGNSGAKVEIFLPIKIPHATADATCNVEFESPVVGMTNSL